MHRVDECVSLSDLKLTKIYKSILVEYFLSETIHFQKSKIDNKELICKPGHKKGYQDNSI